MRYVTLIATVFVGFAVGACDTARDVSGFPAGSRGGDCYANGTCDGGLKCVSNTCINDSGGGTSLPACVCCGCDSGGSLSLSYGSCPSGFTCAAVGNEIVCLPGSSSFDLDTSYECKGSCYPPQCPQCQPSCSGHDCGDDGCGGSCGNCEQGEVCSDGQCVDSGACTSTCGSEGCECGVVCGTSCGSCPEGNSCNDGCHCQCMPQCSGKECGDDGCGESCGSCGGGESCQDGQCAGGTHKDSTSGLTWQITPTGGTMNWSDAKAHCAAISLAGAGWRLPSISELRSLIRGCEITHWNLVTNAGGACGVTDDCLSIWTCYDGCKDPCPWRGGHGADGRYIDAVYNPGGEYSEYNRHWSSSKADEGGVWYVSFADGGLYYWNALDVLPARCVRE